MDDMNLVLLVGELKGRLEALEKRVTELESRPVAAPGGGGGGGKWVETGNTSHTITHIARSKASNNSTFLVLWNGRGNFAVSFFWIGEKNKDEILAQIETLSGVKFTTLPWVNDLKAENLKEQMKPCQAFVFEQVIKERESDGKKKYFFKGLSPVAVQHPAPTASNGTTMPAKTPPSERNYNLDAKLLEAWKKYGVPEAKARMVLEPIMENNSADLTLGYLAQPIYFDDALFEKGFIVPRDEKWRTAMYEYGKRLYGLSETQVKTIFGWLGKAKLQEAVQLPSEPDQCKVWHFEYAIDLAHNEVKVSV